MTLIFTHNTNEEKPSKRIGRLTFDLWKHNKIQNIRMVARMCPLLKKKKSFLFASNVQILTVRHIDKDNKYLYNQPTDQSSQEH